MIPLGKPCDVDLSFYQDTASLEALFEKKRYPTKTTTDR